eukprot:TRINITY_DN16107_c0_g1_i1.p1 TRINITY_DN16107_c0_g1~~TRINITY_DN16107_c0_g1_i1.p1  ORF type:complete len:181 (-),score=47.55 TRINITY_DN16107_c0_g1_i1:219-761(-)
MGKPWNKLTCCFFERNGPKDYRLLARKLHITWSDDSRYWKWTFPPESRFPEVAELMKVCWLEIKGNINASELSPKTKYKVYLVLKFGRRVSGLDILPAETSVKVGSHESSGIAFLQQAMKPRADGQVPQARSDGWLEIEMGEFFNDGGDGVVEMSFKEVRGGHWKSGLIIGGMEIRAVRV